VSEIRDWLEGLRSLGMRPGLEVTAAFLSRLGMPQMKFPCIHVAGSNGKGSLSVILANSLTLSGISCGLFTSPHLCFVEERVRIDGVPISSEKFDQLLIEIRKVAEQEPTIMPTYYEATFLVAMLAFAEAGVDRAVIETGLGGRLDATRLCQADYCVLTELSLEHTEILGDTLGEIAAEKAAIARPSGTFIAKWTYDASARKAIEETVVSPSNAYWWRFDRDTIVRFDKATESHRPVPKFDGYDRLNSYQKDAMNLAEVVLAFFWPTGDNTIDAFRMVKSAVMHTVWPGRMQWLEHEGVPLLLDAAHNPSGMEKVCEQLRAQMENNIHPTPGVIILGSTPQTNLIAFLHPLIELIVAGEVEHVIVTEPQKGRRVAIPTNEIAAELGAQGVPAKVEQIADPEKALERALELAKGDPTQPVLAFGSLYLAGNLLQAMGLDDVESMTVLRPSPEKQYWT
jgi:dihydrofolate synthase/folylpolyglutamate synthase|tara:strand:- start:1274 stop:2641 length:1368 start_codon:yes stop_codon:yes gene_type:complete